jgi:hypothetical protein
MRQSSDNKQSNGYREEGRDGIGVPARSPSGNEIEGCDVSEQGPGESAGTWSWCRRGTRAARARRPWGAPGRRGRGRLRHPRPWGRRRAERRSRRYPRPWSASGHGHLPVRRPGGGALCGAADAGGWGSIIARASAAIFIRGWVH